MGKSGQIGRKISSTLSSTGTPSLFLHPAESSHGDLGLLTLGDLIIAISYGGETPELQDMVKFAARKNIPVILLTGSKTSSMDKVASVVLDIGVKIEACPLKLAPTASSTVTLALGDALAMALLKRRGFKEEDFAQFHPGGSLGRRLLTRVQDVMHSGESLALVNETTAMREVLALMTQKEVRGVAGVIDALRLEERYPRKPWREARQLRDRHRIVNLVGVASDFDCRCHRGAGQSSVRWLRGLGRRQREIGHFLRSSQLGLTCVCV